jgi:hypothetical protein
MLASKIKKVLRRETCNDCEFRRGDFKLLGITLFKRIPQCKLCQCAIYPKTALKTSKCPIDKW